MSGIGFANLRSPSKKENQIGSSTTENAPLKLTRTQSSVILVTILLFNFGYWFTVEFPQTLGDTFLRQFHITPKEVGYIYSISFFCSIVLSPLTGVLISRFGIPNISLLMSFFIFAGNVIAYLGVRANSFNLLLIGRIVFSLGSEPILIVQASASEKWFSGKLLSISMGLNFTCGLLAGSLGNYFTPIVMVEQRNMEAAFFCYVCAGAFSFLSVAVFALMDWKFADLIQNELDDNGKGSNALRQPLNSQNEKIDDEGKVGEIDREGQKIREIDLEAAIEATSGENYSFKLSHLWKLGPLYWGCVGIYTFASNSYYQFVKVITNASVHRFGYSYLRAKNFLSIIQLLSAFFMPFNSIFILNYGKKMKVLLFSTAALLIAYTTMLLSPSTPSLSFEAGIFFVVLFEVTYDSTSQIQAVGWFGEHWWEACC